jgi:cyclase
MLTKRIIACLDVKDGRTVKGVQFEGLKDMGDPVELGSYYAAQGIDELVFLDITATIEKRKALSDLVKRIGHHVNIPFTVGGGINGIEDVSVLLASGADKITINTAAVKDPNLIKQLANEFGSQCIVLSVDTKFQNDEWIVYIHGGRTPTELRTRDWTKQAESLGAGEILLTSINNDGNRTGFAVEFTKEISEKLNIPVIVSGGAGTMDHFAEVFIKGNADAALAAGIFHENIISIPALKKYLKSKSIPIRL